MLAVLQGCFSMRISMLAILQAWFSLQKVLLQRCKSTFPRGLAHLQSKNNTFPHKQPLTTIILTTLSIYSQIYWLKTSTIFAMSDY